MCLMFCLLFFVHDKYVSTAASHNISHILCLGLMSSSFALAQNSDWVHFSQSLPQATLNNSQEVQLDQTLPIRRIGNPLYGCILKTSHFVWSTGLPGNCLSWEVVGDYFPDLYYRDWPTAVSQPVPYTIPRHPHMYLLRFQCFGYQYYFGGQNICSVGFLDGIYLHI